jgi:hypothetical protein
MTTQRRFRLTPMSLTAGMFEPSNTGFGSSPANAAVPASTTSTRARVTTSAPLPNHFRFTSTSCL